MLLCVRGCLVCVLAVGESVRLFVLSPALSSSDFLLCTQTDTSGYKHTRSSISIICVCVCLSLHLSLSSWCNSWISPMSLLHMLPWWCFGCVLDWGHLALSSITPSCLFLSRHADHRHENYVHGEPEMILLTLNGYNTVLAVFNAALTGIYIKSRSQLCVIICYKLEPTHPVAKGWLPRNASILWNPA